MPLSLMMAVISTADLVYRILIPSIPYIFETFFGSILTIVSIKNQFCGINKSKLSSLNTIQKCTILCSCLSFLFLCLHGLLFTILKIVEFPNSRLRSCHIIFVFVVIFGHLIWISMYVHGLLRLIIVFQDTPYPISKQTIKLYVFSLIFTIVLEGTFLILEKESNIAFFNNGSRNRYFLVISLLPSAFCGALILYQFNSKLFKLVVQEAMSRTDSEQSTRSRSNSEYYHGKSNEYEYDLTASQIQTLSVAAKHTILGNFIVFFIIIGLIYSAVCTLLEMSYDIHFSNRYYRLGIGNLYDGGTSLLLAAVSYCQFLGFSVNNKQYLWSCHWCDRKLRIKCTKMAKKKLNYKKQQYRNMAMELTVELTETNVDSM